MSMSRLSRAVADVFQRDPQRAPLARRQFEVPVEAVVERAAVPAIMHAHAELERLGIRDSRRRSTSVLKRRQSGTGS